MVLQVPPQPDADMLGFAHDLKFQESELMQSAAFGPQASMWRCATYTAEGIGYWIGHRASTSIELFAYLALIPRDLDALRVLEAKKGWTAPDWRRKGLGRSLLEEAAKSAPLLSDADGMTAMAYAQWNSATEFERRWWDDERRCFVDDTVVPPEDRFTAFDSGKRWLMILELR